MKQLDELCKSACAFHCDKNYRLFVTVVQSEGIFIMFPASPSRFTFNNCDSGTAMQIPGTVAGIYGIRRLQVKRSGRLGLGPSSHLTVATTGDLMQFRAQSALSPLQKWETQSSFMAKVSAVS